MIRGATAAGVIGRFRTAGLRGMSLGLYDSRRRRRRRIWRTALRIGFYMALLTVVAVQAFRFGVEHSQGQVEQLNARVAALQEANATLEQDAIQLEAAARTAQVRYRDLLERYDREVPTGLERDLVGLVAQRLADGVPPERLAFYIRSATAARDCTEPSTRRFIMPTPVYQGPNTSIAFADGRITVTGMGQSAHGPDGAPLGWFDPAEDVTVAFTLIGGEQSSTTGPLPLHHSVVLGSEEHRFTIVAGERAMVNVTADRCAFP